MMIPGLKVRISAIYPGSVSETSSLFMIIIPKLFKAFPFWNLAETGSYFFMCFQNFLGRGKKSLYSRT